MDMSITVDKGQLRHIEKNCTPELYGESVTRIVTKAAIEGENEGKRFSPVDKGIMRARMTHQVMSTGPAASSRYGVTSKQALPLDQPVTRNPHYRGGPQAGASTAGWLTKRTLPRVQQAIDDAIASEVRKIEAAWSS